MISSSLTTVVEVLSTLGVRISHDFVVWQIHLVRWKRVDVLYKLPVVPIPKKRVCVCVLERVLTNFLFQIGNGFKMNLVTN